MNGYKYAATQSKTQGGMVMGLLTYILYQLFRVAMPAIMPAFPELPDGGEILPAIMVGAAPLKETAAKLKGKPAA